MTDQTRVRIAYDPENLERNGSVVDIDAEEARTLIRTGRAALATGEDLYDAEADRKTSASGSTKADLVAIAEANGVDASGTKADLAARLTEAGIIA